MADEADPDNAEVRAGEAAQDDAADQAGEVAQDDAVVFVLGKATTKMADNIFFA